MATWKKVLTEDSPVSASGLSSTGDVTVQLDSDNNTSDSKFEILKGDGSVLLSVNESGITTGSLTTPTPVVVLGSSTYAQGATAAAIISNYDSAAEYTMGIYDSSGNLQGISPTLSNGVITFPAPAIVATGWELRVKAAKIGFFTSLEDVDTFQTTPTRTFTHWRIKGYTSSGSPTTDRIFLSNVRFFSDANQTGTELPATNMTSNTSESGITLSAGYSFNSSYAPWKATDQYNYTGWWSLSVSSAASNWWQIEFDTARTFASVELNFYSTNTQADNVKIFGSSTGNFTGEEIEVVDISGVDAGVSGQDLIKQANF
jgi:hypothetical protein